MSVTTAAEDAQAKGLTEQALARTLVGSMVIGFAIMALVVAMTGWMLIRAQEFQGLVDHTYEVEARIADYRVRLEQAEAARRGLLLSGRVVFTDVFDGAVDSLNPILERLKILTVDNPVQQRRLQQLEVLQGEKVALFNASITLRRTAGLNAAVEAFQNPREQALIAAMRNLTDEMTAEERTLLAERSTRQSSNGRALLVVVLLAGAMLAFLAVGSTWTMRRFARDLNRSRSALARLNEGLEAAVRERTADLTRANDEIQRFAYIVSHDLRSPLVNIMGFTSELETASKPLSRLVEQVKAHAPGLVTKEATDAVEVDLPESIGFIRSSTQKMDRLISAILKLSREGRRSLNPEPLNMGEVVGGVMQSLTKQAEARGAAVEIDGVLPDIVADRVAVEQVFSNLIENALKYLKPGRPGEVRVRGRLEGQRVLFEVQDNGRGIDPKDHERVFELFRRAGVQDQAGEGIGLAHVRALVYRLGGLIDCVSALDEGATFRLSLPRVQLRDSGE
jgi:signal transduction histidine kinase